MKGNWAYVSGFLDLPKIGKEEDRRATWRQSMAMLARACAESEVSPLEGLSPHALARGIQSALSSGLVDDLDFLAPPAAGAALYDLAAALPIGVEQKELGRRVFSRLQAANAESFVAIATRMVLSVKGINTQGVRARVALTFELPISVGVADGPLALGLASSRELVREWITLPSMGSLPARRLTARLIERAAREASKRALQGDEHAIRMFRSGAVRDAFDRLLSDRESLVWRHLAIARGLVAPWVEDLQKTVVNSLSARLTPTEWRRGATSIAAMIAVSGESATRLAISALEGESIQRDPGIAAALTWGMSRGGEAEPEAAAVLLLKAVPVAPLEVGEALAELRIEYGRAPFLEKAVELAVKELRERTRTDDDGIESLADTVIQELSGRTSGKIQSVVQRALASFVSDGAKGAYAQTKGLLGAASGAIESLEEGAKAEDADPNGAGGDEARRASFDILRDVDVSLLERSVVTDLFRLGSDTKQEEQLDLTRGRLAAWILGRETSREVSNATATPRHFTLRMRRLRALLHLVDNDLAPTSEAAEPSVRRWYRVVDSLLEQLSGGAPKMLRRLMFAALARALDALVRAQLFDVADAFMLCAHAFVDPTEFATLSEASMDPELVHTFQAYSRFLKELKSGSAETNSDAPPESTTRLPSAHPDLAALERLSADLFLNSSSRREAIRTALVRINASLRKIAVAPSLKAVAGDSDALSALENALGAVGQITQSALRKLEAEGEEEQVAQRVSITLERELLSVLVTRIVAQGGPQLTKEGVEISLRALMIEIPRALREPILRVIMVLLDVPIERPSDANKAIEVGSEHLPPWLPPRRTLGGFYIVRSLGSGAAGSVFMARRVEERHDPTAERFALKVPDYSVTAARSLSEEAFMNLFRSEASALLTLPAHSNLARFVTFDLGSRPKPILVMEMVDGVTLEHLVSSRALDTKRAIKALDDVLKGLEAMHSVGIGHLDVKPANVVLRDATEGVLVDFGLSGRNVRPGCATGPYGAPEVWGASDDAKPSPLPADIYAFGCIAFEALTGKQLIEAPNEMALIAMHISHDGSPPLLQALAKQPAFAKIAELLASTLRRDAKLRPDVRTVRTQLAQVAKSIEEKPWPLTA